jgi:hypothetical protein
MEVHSPLNMGQKSGGNPLKQLETALEDASKKLPQLPPAVKEFIVKFGPYLIALGVIAWVLSLLSMLGLGGVSALSYYGVAYGSWSYYWTVTLLTLAAQVILEALALPGLFKRTKQGWDFMFYATLAGIIGNILSLNIVGALIGGAISLYITFQVREYYK